LGGNLRSVFNEFESHPQIEKDPYL